MSVTTNGLGVSVRRSEIAGLSVLTLGPEDAPVEVVFLHANGFHAALYVDILAPLAVGRRIVVPDQRGHGRTRLPADPATFRGWDIFSEDAVRLLEALGARPVVLAGHSLGGCIAALAAAGAPSRARAVALFEPVIDAPSLGGRTAPEVLEHAVKMARGAASRRRRFASRADAIESYRGRGPFRTWPESALAAYVEEGFVDAAETPEGGEGVVLRCDPDWEGAIYAVRVDPWEALTVLCAPLWIRAAVEGSTFPPASEQRLRALLPDADVARVEGTTHFLPVERPDVVRATIAAALAAR